MLLKTKVKVGNVTNLSDARYCAGMGVDLLGFPIGNGDNQITHETFEEIATWVAGPQFVFEYTDGIDHSLFQKVTQSPSIQHIQVTYAQYAELAPQLRHRSVILEANLKEWALIEKENLPLAYLILKDPKANNWEQIAKINSKVPVLVPYTYIQSDIEDITQLPITGLVLSGSAEHKPGHKNYDHLADVLESLEVDP